MKTLMLQSEEYEFACRRCNSGVELNARSCIVCHDDVGYPNVRAANENDEVNGLHSRVSAATSGRTEADLDALERFRQAVSKSEIVVARSLEAVYELVRSDKHLDIPFHRAVASGARIPGMDSWDKWRAAAESIIFPNFYQDIVFGALSIDGYGPSAYGRYSITLKTDLISHRSSVFEENPFFFNRRHGIYPGDTPPKGYRASWDNRSQLAIAKLQSFVTGATPVEDYARILLKQGSTTAGVDCVEVHCFGSIHRRAIARVKGPKAADSHESWLCDEIQRYLGEVGAELELV